MDKAPFWLKVIVRAIAQFSVVLEWWHADTTSLYFEGAYQDEQGQPLKEAHAPCLVEGYNKDGKQTVYIKGLFAIYK